MPFDSQNMSLPEEFLYKLKSFKNATKQTIEVLPSSGQTSYGPSSKVSFTLPYSSLISMADIHFMCDGETSGEPVIAGSSTAACSVLFPRNFASMIDEVEIKINGQIVQSITRYNDLVNILDAQKPAKTVGAILQNMRPWEKHYYTASSNTYTAVNDMEYNALADAKKDKGTFGITSWYGLLGSDEDKEASANFVDTNLLGEVIISFRFAQPNVLQYSKKNAGEADADVLAAKTAANPSYLLSNLKLSVQRYNLPDSYYSAINSNLQSGSKYRIAFNHYSFYSAVANQSGSSVRFHENSRDIKYLLGFFTHSDRDSSTKPTDTITDNAFYQNKYFQYQGFFHEKSNWTVGSTQLPQNQMSTADCFLDLTRLKGVKGVVDYEMGGGRGIYDINEWARHYFVSPLSLEFSEDDDKVKLMSGLSTENLPISLSWNYNNRTIGGGFTMAHNANVLVVTSRMLEIGNGQSVAVAI